MTLAVLLTMALAICIATLLVPFATITYTDGLGLGKIQRPEGPSLSLFPALYQCVVANTDLHFGGRLLAFFVLASSCAGVGGLVATLVSVAVCRAPTCVPPLLRRQLHLVAGLAIDGLQLDVFWVAVMLVHGQANALAHSMRPELIMAPVQIAKLEAGR